MGFKQHISRTWQMIEQQVNDVPFRPHDEAVRQVKAKEPGIYAGFGIQNPTSPPLCMKSASGGAKVCKEVKIKQLNENTATG